VSIPTTRPASGSPLFPYTTLFRSAHGVDAEGGHFTQRYGSPEVDASLLMIPLVGFVPADDPRMLATIKVIEQDLCEDGLVRRYRTGDQANEEGLFLICCFWLDRKSVV